MALVAGCSDEPEAEAAKKKSLDAGPPDAAPPQDVPQSPTEIFKSLPNPPPPAVARPGDPVSAVTDGHREITRSPVSSRILQGRYPGGAFPLVTYLIDDARRVRSITLHLDPRYSHPVRRDALFEAARAKLQDGKALDHPRYSGEVWSELNHRIELRQDPHTEQMELVFHVEGARPLPVP
ncbi:MAG: hypothetical protein ACE366_25740 [Bradymonadia bacterium]